jgi:VWFA-related protein
MRVRLRTGILSVVVGLPACAVTSWCQLAPSPDASPVSTATASPDEKPVATFKQTVNLVDLFFTVRDGKGSLIPHLNQQNCSVSDENEPQSFKSFVAETDQPLTLGILLDTSLSQVPWLPMEQDAGSQFIQQVLRSKDEAFLLSFDVDVNLLQDYTDSPGMLIHALSTAEINGGGGAVTMTYPSPVPIPRGDPIPDKPKVDPGPVPIRNPRGTLLYDAIYLAANEKMNQEAGRKAMIILTDGDDQGSSMTSQDAVAATEKDNIIVYVVWAGSPGCLMGAGGPMSPGQPSQPGPSPQRMLDDWRAECDRANYFLTPCPGYYVAECIAEHTGGRIIVAGNSKKLEAAFQQIEDELRSQYWASYTPDNEKADGSFHRVSIACHGDDGQNLKVRVRRGYYAPAGK